jgi:hypothetical protein
MILAYGVTHEKWVWDVRSEPGVIDAFAKVYDDEDLIVSFDVVNVQFAKYVPGHFLSLPRLRSLYQRVWHQTC